MKLIFKFYVFISLLSFCLCENRSPFVKLGSYPGEKCIPNNQDLIVHKSYYAPKHIQGSWRDAITYCKAFDMELVSFQTYNELEAVRDMRMKFQSSVAEHILVSGMTDEPRSKNNWYWVHTGENISFNIPWQPTEPNNSDGVERCLQATLSNSIGFNDIECSGDFNYHYTFICQKIDFISHTCY